MTGTPPPAYQPTHYAQPNQYPGSQWQPRVVRPPLSARQKRSSRWAGIVGFNLLSLGWALIIAPVVLALFAAVFTFILGQWGSTEASSTNGFAQVRSFVDAQNVAAWVLPLLAVALLGVGIWALGIFVSGRILKSRAVKHPWGVTWAAAGIAIVASSILSWIGGTIVKIASVMLFTGEAQFSTFVVSGIIALVVTITVNTVIGWLAWWWMAHVLRSVHPIA
jgi:hypothetical protein